MMHRAWPAIALIAIVVAASGAPRPDESGPATAAATRTAFLFQAYDCAACSDWVTSGARDELLAAAAQQDVQIIWNIVADAGVGAQAAHCVWVHRPADFVEWDALAFTLQPSPGYGWPRFEGTLYAMESNLLLDRDATRAIESCMEADSSPGITAATEFHDAAPRDLPALWVNGAWRAPVPAALPG
jgi:hypothetical protein